MERIYIFNSMKKELFYLKIKKENFHKIWRKFLLRVDITNIIYTMELLGKKQGLTQEINRIYSDKDCLLAIECRETPKKLSEMTSKEVSTHLANIEFGEVSRIIKNTKMDGEAVGNLTIADYKDIFGIFPDTGQAVVLDNEITKLKNQNEPLPKLLLLGDNTKRILGFVPCLDKAKQLNLPVLDFGETIEGVVIGHKNIIIMTSHFRAFICFQIFREKKKEQLPNDQYLWQNSMTQENKGMLCTSRYNLTQELVEGPKQISEALRNQEEINDGLELRIQMENLNEIPVPQLESPTNSNFEQDLDYSITDIKFNGPKRKKKRNYYKIKKEEKTQKLKLKMQNTKVHEVEEKTIFKSKKSKKKKSELRLENKKEYEWQLLGKRADSIYGFSKDKKTLSSYKSILNPRIKKIVPLKNKFFVLAFGGDIPNIQESNRTFWNGELLLEHIIKTKRFQMKDLMVYLKDEEGYMQKMNLPKFLSSETGGMHMECIKVKNKKDVVWIDRHGVFNETAFL